MRLDAWQGAGDNPHLAPGSERVTISRETGQRDGRLAAHESSTGVLRDVRPPVPPRPRRPTARSRRVGRTCRSVPVTTLWTARRRLGRSASSSSTEHRRRPGRLCRRSDHRGLVDGPPVPYRSGHRSTATGAREGRSASGRGARRAAAVAIRRSMTANAGRRQSGCIESDEPMRRRRSGSSARLRAASRGPPGKASGRSRRRRRRSTWGAAESRWDRVRAHWRSRGGSQHGTVLAHGRPTPATSTPGLPRGSGYHPASIQMHRIYATRGRVPQ